MTGKLYSWLKPYIHLFWDIIHLSLSFQRNSCFLPSSTCHHWMAWWWSKLSTVLGKMQSVTCKWYFFGRKYYKLWAGNISSSLFKPLSLLMLLTHERKGIHSLCTSQANKSRRIKISFKTKEPFLSIFVQLLKFKSFMLLLRVPCIQIQRNLQLSPYNQRVSFHFHNHPFESFQNSLLIVVANMAAKTIGHLVCLLTIILYMT